MRLSTGSTLLLLVVAVSVQPAHGIAFITNFLTQMTELGIFGVDNFFLDFYNLFFGKRRLQCANKIRTLLANSGPLLEGGYRDDSVMVLPEAGTYIGESSILEYVKFADENFSPYVKRGPINLGEQQKVIGYDGNGQCEYHWFRVSGYSMDEDYVEQSESHFALPVLTKVFLSYDDNYMTRAYVYYAKPFLEFYFGDQLNTVQVAEYICGDAALGSAGCRALLGDPPADCVEQLMAKDLTDANLYVDGDSRGCRALHATFVAKNPGHCEHVSLDPTDLDYNGVLKCGISQQLPHSRYFDDGDIERFEAFEREHAIDPSLGYRKLSTIDEPLL